MSKIPAKLYEWSEDLSDPLEVNATRWNDILNCIYVSDGSIYLFNLKAAKLLHEFSLNQNGGTACIQVWDGENKEEMLLVCHTLNDFSFISDYDKIEFEEGGFRQLAEDLLKLFSSSKKPKQIVDEGCGSHH